MKSILGKVLALALLSGICYGDDLKDAELANSKQEYSKAFKLYKKACNNGNNFACGMLGGHYEFGAGVEQNNQLALEYYSKACSMGGKPFCDDYNKLKTTSVINSREKLKTELSVCSKNNISSFDDKRYIEVLRLEQNGYFSILVDSKNIQIDTYNKTIKVWTVWLSTSYGRNQKIKSLGKYDNYDNFGYQMNLDIIDYGNMKSQSHVGSDYNCDGSIIHRLGIDEWRDVMPGSVKDEIVQNIMKIYNLK